MSQQEEERRRGEEERHGEDVESIVDGVGREGQGQGQGRAVSRRRPRPETGILLSVPLSGLTPNTPSIHISYLHPGTRESLIGRALSQAWGHPSEIHIVDRRGGVDEEDRGEGRRGRVLIRLRDGSTVPPSRAVIHMTTWYRTREAQEARREILEGKFVKLYVRGGEQDGFFFGCSLYKFK